MKSSTLNTTPFYCLQPHFWRYSLSLFLMFWGKILSAQDPISQVTESLKPNVVAIKASFADGSEEKGFGFITAEQTGRLYLATAAHVVRGPDKDKSAQHIHVKFLSDIRWHEATFLHHWDKEDLALLELSKPAGVQWQPNCADFAPGTYRKVHFIGLNGNEPRWVDPGLDGNIFEDKDHKLNFAIGTIRPGTSGAPLITEKGIVGLITQDEGGISTALKLTQIRTFFSGGGQYPYFGLQPLITMMPPTDPNKGNQLPPAKPKVKVDAYGLVFVKGGTFTMGCTAEQGNDCYDDEKPSHRVTISDYYIGKYEVTQAQWRGVMGNNPSNFSNCDQCPVEQVSWVDVQNFLAKLNAKTGKNYRLPTEAEWEYAARGGNKSRGYKYAGSNTQSEVAWFSDNSERKTHPVGGKKANELGLYDMSGNVHEWCHDWDGNYSGSIQTNPTGSVSGSNRVDRGGSWNYSARHCRVTSRNSVRPSYRLSLIGFRLAL